MGIYQLFPVVGPGFDLTGWGRICGNLASGD